MSPPDLTSDLEPAALEEAKIAYALLIDSAETTEAYERITDEQRCETIIRAYLSALSEPAAPAGAEEPQSNAIAWLLGCLHHANPTDDSQWHVRPGRHSEFSKAVWAVVSATPQPVEPPDDSLAEVQPVARQWRALEDGEPRTAWKDLELGDRPGWEALAKRDPEKYATERRALYSVPQPPDDSLNDIAADPDAFPPTWCTAWEDCNHDGLCHDPQGCGGVGPNSRETQPAPSSDDKIAEDRDRWRRVAERLETEKQSLQAELAAMKEGAAVKVKRLRVGDYPVGTKVYSVIGGHWTRTETGWEASGGDTFPHYGADAFEVELPASVHPAPADKGVVEALRDALIQAHNLIANTEFDAGEAHDWAVNVDEQIQAALALDTSTVNIEPATISA